MPTVDSVFDQVRDLAAVRVATYVQTDERKVAEAICRSASLVVMALPS